MSRLALRLAAAAVAVGTTLPLGGCTGPDIAPTPGSQESSAPADQAVESTPLASTRATPGALRTQPPGRGSDGAQLIGELVIDGKPHCVAVRDELTRELNVIVWPAGFALDAENRIVDGEGVVVAGQGDTVELGGGYVGPLPDCPDATGAFVTSTARSR